MQKLYDKLKKYSIDDAIKIEESDRQYIALKKMGNYFKEFFNISSWKKDYNNIYLSLVLGNSIICYQLSWKGEDYWEEFSNYFCHFFNSEFNNKELVKFTINNNKELVEYVIELLWNFIKQSKNNKRFVDTKIKRLEKLKPFLERFIWSEWYFYDNMEKLRNDLAKIMKQKLDAKTIVFSVKMFSYWARNIFNKLNYFPENIAIPIDSRLINLYEKYNFVSENVEQKEIKNLKEIKNFYLELSKKIKIPELHLDALVWVNYDELIK